MEITLRGITVKVPQLDKIAVRLTNIEAMGELIMGKLDDAITKLKELSAKVVSFNSALDEIRAGVSAIKEQLAALQSGEVLSDVVAGKVQEVADLVDELEIKVDETIAENTPSGPSEPPPDEV